ncbi:hypothetical protein M0804_002262 [Polistes exclamans]|nr:hypothetical protein M0804_002262 [Polistes exclamans]
MARQKRRRGSRHGYTVDKRKRMTGGIRKVEEGLLISRQQQQQQQHCINRSKVVEAPAQIDGKQPGRQTTRQAAR